MVRDMSASPRAGLGFALPAKISTGLMAARLALVGSDEGWIAALPHAPSTWPEFAHAADISDRQALGTILQSLHLDSQKIFSRIEQADLKQRLERQTAEAQARGIFGAPSFLVGDELFWGDDRLEQALAWARRG
jgi:2-hydroxychromene-2-carboxylate isomerase